MSWMTASLTQGISKPFVKDAIHKVDAKQQLDSPDASPTETVSNPIQDSSNALLTSVGDWQTQQYLLTRADSESPDENIYLTMADNMVKRIEANPDANGISRANMGQVLGLMGYGANSYSELSLDQQLVIDRFNTDSDVNTLSTNELSNLLYAADHARVENDGVSNHALADTIVDYTDIRALEGDTDRQYLLSVLSGTEAYADNEALINERLSEGSFAISAESRKQEANLLQESIPQGLRYGNHMQSAVDRLNSYQANFGIEQGAELFAQDIANGNLAYLLEDEKTPGSIYFVRSVADDDSLTPTEENGPIYLSYNTEAIEFKNFTPGQPIDENSGTVSINQRTTNKWPFQIDDKTEVAAFVAEHIQPDIDALTAVGTNPDHIEAIQSNILSIVEQGDEGALKALLEPIVQEGGQAIGFESAGVNIYNEPGSFHLGYVDPDSDDPSANDILNLNLGALQAMKGEAELTGASSDQINKKLTEVILRNALHEVLHIKQYNIVEGSINAPPEVLEHYSNYERLGFTDSVQLNGSTNLYSESRVELPAYLVSSQIEAGLQEYWGDEALAYSNDN